MAMELEMAVLNATIDERVGELAGYKAVESWPLQINTFFVLVSGYIVFVMQAGFCLLTVGSVQSKSARSVCLKNLMDACFGGIGFWLLGWAFAYGDAVNEDGMVVQNGFIGSRQFLMVGLDSSAYYVWFFQWVFAISTATIVSGAVAERTRFEAYALYAFFLTAWVYPLLAHWVWSPAGWACAYRAPTAGPLLFGSGAYDAVGSGAVHMTGGLAALAGAWVVGPRMGRFDSDGKPREMPGHNSVLFILGVFLLWFGFYGFNPGTMAMVIVPADGSGFMNVVARCVISTTMGAMFGGATGLLLHTAVTYARSGKVVYDLNQAACGALCGMVVITSGCATYYPYAAAIGGVIGGLVYYPSSQFVLRVMKIDDPVDAFVVHGVCGCLGVIYMALMANEEYTHAYYGATFVTPDGEERTRPWGLFYGGGGRVLAANVVWLLVITGWTLANMVPFFMLLNKFNLLRVPPEEEQVGSDVSHHGGSAYVAQGTVTADVSAKSVNDMLKEYKPKGETSLDDKVQSLEATVAALQRQIGALSGGV